MYNQIVNTLGISQNTLEVFVLSSIGVLILGLIFVMYWKYIVSGLVIVFCLMVFANKLPDSAEAKTTKEVKQETPIDSDKPLFMEDCLKHTDYTKDQCENIWENRESA